MTGRRVPSTPCTWCGFPSDGCKERENDAFHVFMRRHDLHSEGWSLVGDGWIGLLDRLVVELKGMGWTGHVAQIKQKMGTLRFYTDNFTDAMRDRIQAAYAESAVTCEQCGKPATLRYDLGGDTYRLRGLCGGVAAWGLMTRVGSKPKATARGPAGMRHHLSPRWL